MSLYQPYSYGQIAISAHSLAKSDLGKRDRARLAAEWVAGKVQLAPTLNTAALIFNVSAALIRQERVHVSAPPSSEEQLAAIIRFHGVEEVWNALVSHL